MLFAELSHWKMCEMWNWQWGASSVHDDENGTYLYDYDDDDVLHDGTNFVLEKTNLVEMSHH